MSHPYPVDTLGLWDATAGLPEQLGAAADGAIDVLRRVTLPARLDLRSVVVCGVGSSGLAGDAAAAMGASIPIVVSKGDDVPAFVGPDSLVFAVSWSGDTEETVMATYSHMMPDDRDRARKAMERFFSRPEQNPVSASVRRDVP